MPIPGAISLKGKTKKKALTKDEKKEKIAELKKEFVNKLLKFAKEKGHFPWQEPNFSNFPKRLAELEKIKKNNENQAAEPRNRNEAIYKGSNLIRLSMVADERGYSDSRWATFNFIKEHDGWVKAGETGTKVLHYSPPTPCTKINSDGKLEYDYVKDEDGSYKLDKNGKKIIKMKPGSEKVFTVFNICQTEGLKLEPEPPMLKLDEKDKCPAMEIIIANSEAPVKHDQYTGFKRYYSPMLDEVHVPPVNMFKSISAYYATVAHEIGHSTGHSTRCNRDLSGSFGSSNYAREEMVAELTAVFLSCELGIKIPPKELDNHAEYMRAWDQEIKTLTEKPEELNKIINDAQKASDYIKEHMLEKNLKQEKTVEQTPKENAKAVVEVAQKPRPKVNVVKRHSSSKTRTVRGGASR